MKNDHHDTVDKILDRIEAHTDFLYVFSYGVLLVCLCGLLVLGIYLITPVQH